MSPSRRDFIKSSALLGTALAAPAIIVPRSFAQVRLADDPFTLGVASGDPLSDGFVIWTRLAPRPMDENYGMADVAVPVEWELAENESMNRIVRRGTAIADPALGHSVHVEFQGLAAGRPYWYRFRTGDHSSAVGRAITTPVEGSPADSLRFAFVSCQHYERGFFAAYRDLVEQDPDLVIHLGDYMYENDPGRFAIRRHTGPEPVTLAQYRQRYACYRTDPELQAAHAHTSWLFTWDDHEVDNNYANDQSQDFDEPAQFLQRRAAAYQAYYEMMPLRGSARPRGPHMRLYQRVAFGDLVAFHVLDDRQYRSDHPCDFDGGGSPVIPALCEELNDPARTLLGDTQERWLRNHLRDSQCQWNVLAQQTLFAEFNRGSPEVPVYATDGWGGYPVARDRIVDYLQRFATPNPVFIGGDVHSYWVTDIKSDWRDPDSPTVASEFVGTSITSGGGDMDEYNALLPQNPHVRFIETRERGYTLCEISRGEWRASHRSMPDARVVDPAAYLSTARRFVVENGRAGAQLD